MYLRRGAANGTQQRFCPSLAYFLYLLINRGSYFNSLSLLLAEFHVCSAQSSMQIPEFHY